MVEMEPFGLGHGLAHESGIMAINRTVVYNIGDVLTVPDHSTGIPPFNISLPFRFSLDRALAATMNQVIYLEDSQC